MRLGLIAVLAAVLIIGCKTPEQKAQAKLDKQQAAELKAQQKQAAADAKSAKKRAEEQAKAEKKAAKQQAKAEKKEKPESVRHIAMAQTDYYPDDRLKVIGYPDILPENRPQWLDKHAQAMAAAGASLEAMLYEDDFSGSELTLMGQSRLRLMMQSPPTTIYVVSAGGEAQKQARFAAVHKFWQDETARQIAVTEGINPDLSSPANAGLSALQRIEKGEEQRSGAGASGSGMTAQPYNSNTPSRP